MKKCDYCAKEISYFDQYCDEYCHAKANKYYESIEKFAKFFSIINTICVFGIPLGIFLFAFAKVPGAIIAGASCAILGTMLMILPFPTETMISKFKIQKASKITRIIGACVIALGILIILFMIFFVTFSE